MAEPVGTVLVRSECVGLLQTTPPSAAFPVRLRAREQQGAPPGLVYLDAYPEGQLTDRDFVDKLQSYVDELCKDADLAAGEDSSYDSDYEAEERHQQGHQDVSRTVSDTLGAEFAEYVSLGAQVPGYTAKVEFALKLGYTERLVQAALQKLGPNPGQNELLAELIKLGAQGPRVSDAGIDGSSENVDIIPDSVLLEGQGCLLRPVVIDGSNVAMSHGNKEVFSCRGIKLCVDWFLSRGHSEITVFVPKWRKEAPRPDNPITDQDILSELERDRYLVFTPSRLVGGKRMVCYDDRYILRLASENEGIVVSNDNYRDLAQENPEFKKVVEERILMYSFVNDRFMPPDDPLGRTGPTLENFLRIQPRKGDPPRPCPYGKKCTYGNKCKYHHPERGPLPHKSVTERLSEHAQRHLQARSDPIPLKTKSLSLPGELRKPSVNDRLSEHAQRHLERLGERCQVKGKSLSLPLAGEVRKTPLSRAKAGEGKSDARREEENLHRKLQRQLTLNPACDPRLMRRHRPLSRHSSNAEGQNQYALQMQMQQQSPSQWDLHQSVTRIASAPDSFRPWPPGARLPHHMQRLSSTSDPQINLCVAGQPWQPLVWPPGLAFSAEDARHVAYSTEDARHKLRYHLAAIFPEDQVHQAMQLYPEETNAQKICAAILSMFPKESMG